MQQPPKHCKLPPRAHLDFAWWPLCNMLAKGLGLYVERCGNVLRIRKFRQIPEGAVTNPGWNLPQMTAIENFSWGLCSAPADTYRYQKAATTGLMKIFPDRGESLQMLKKRKQIAESFEDIWQFFFLIYITFDCLLSAQFGYRENYFERNKMKIRQFAFNKQTPHKTSKISVIMKLEKALSILLS